MGNHAPFEPGRTKIIKVPTLDSIAYLRPATKPSNQLRPDIR